MPPKLRKYARRKFAHRNGETTQPTIKGWYWVVKYYGEFAGTSTHPLYFNGTKWDNHIGATWMEPQYYGPIPDPWTPDPLDIS